MSIMKLRFEREFSLVNCEFQQFAPENSRIMKLRFERELSPANSEFQHSPPDNSRLT